MSKFFALLSVLGTGFIVWVIYLANTGAHSVFFELVQRIPFGDKLGHFGLFGTLSFLLIAASGGRTILLAGREIFIASAIVTLFVTGEELSQLFITTRTFDIVDWLADAAGIAAASLAYSLYRDCRDNIPPWQS
ncbi:trypsin [Aestuariibacter sp. GS-14]|uniref:VanZ family protein n=1 Tax=Aestuariibacter sp. GS-14 TaxID=2590670 RepID=UPI00112A1199|nr:VanZ family protein [Aestuariibacter sp. GS-14]TPV56031.1 trypsin [Aestuariibacter sp. GS-14]